MRDDIEFGLEPGDELHTSTTICHKVRETGQSIVISDLAQAQNYSWRPAPAALDYRSYISVPIILGDGSFFGTLCAIDPKPAQLDAPETIGMFKLFTDLLAFHIEATLHPMAAKPAQGDTGLGDATGLGKEFIRVLGHDLRSPLATINMSAWALGRMELGEKVTHTVDVIHNSVVRMSGLIDNMLDFADGRLGGEMKLERDADEPLEPVLSAVVAECRANWPDRALEVEFALAMPVDCDRGRIAHLCSNLLRNAFAYGAADQPVRLRAASGGGEFELTVANAGDPIPPELQARLFGPYIHGTDQPGRHGVGLGLHVAAAIARAHGGQLSFCSSPAETCFTFRMKLAKS